MIFHHKMAIFLALMLLPSVLVSDLRGAQSSGPFPYQATVVVEDAAVYSGPGSVHYVSSKMGLGKPIRVYRHDPGGWCAIRPPKGSFSLVPATVVEELGNGVGEITEDGSQAWVGTELGPVEKPLWQVKLKSGEQVKLLGVATWPDPDGFTTSWYQIEPPAGEFRWIKMDDLKIPPHVQQWQMAAREVNSSSNSQVDDSAYPQDSVSKEVVAPAVQPEDRQAAFISESDPPQQIEQATYTNQDRVQSGLSNQIAQSKPTNSGWRKARFPIDRSRSDSNNFASDIMTRDSNVNASSDLNRFNSPPERYASADLDARYDFNSSAQGWSAGASTTTSNSGAPLTNRLTELELKLNQEMIKEPNQWRLIDLQTAAEQVVTISSDRMEQEQAQRFLAKLENCRYLRDQYIRGGSVGMNANYQANANGSGFQTGMSGAAQPGNGSDFSLDTMYDAHGWLKELVREGGRAEPTYVLQNESGKVTHHVQPGPGMNLSSYVSKRIGIMGQRGYHTRLKLDHVTVQKVIELK